ncbi:MAG TPA: 2-oxo-4-hydroxy-4-carboxy-5-ureidoimidazoline decarboxylase [Pyrinomonadaceae bacterium]|nr:2-oxo-4-hydroxy-4-carboxy-5-ureidoimidazoline decarboxylase [Pyrinomonadaceae bacterium]
MERLNSLPQEEAEAELLKCCGSTLWARRMAEERPFHGLEELLARADAEWWALDAEDWLEAFSRHPKIGEKESARAQAAAAQNWSEQEQAGTRSADEETKRQLAAANREYESKFGYIYIVCATGKTADEMLSLCRERLSNGPEDELRVAAEEQRRITHLRLRKLLEAD